MTAVAFRSGLETQMIDLLKPVVGTGTDPVNYVKTFDVFLHDLPHEDYPYLVVTITTVDQVAPGEMGTLRELTDYNVVLYYLDITTQGETYQDGERRRDAIAHKIQIALENDPRIGNYRLALGENTDLSEYVFDSDFTSFIFDSSGQEEFYTFVTELHLVVRTAKN